MTPAAWPLPRWIAHRGAGRSAPENTLAAFRAGAAYGYRGFECDAKLSADGVPFLLHDATLDRTTNGQGAAAERSWSELSQLDAGSWHSRSFAGEPPASLAAIAAFVQRNSFALNIEIKPSPGTDAETGRTVASAVRELWRGARQTPLLSSFRPDALSAARDAAPELPRALLLDTLWDGWFERAVELGCVAVVTNYACMDAAIVARLHASNRRALCYTVNDPAPAAQLIAIGVDGLITDAVDRFAPAGEAAGR